MSAFLRFPHTPHLAWLGTGKPRDDKVLSPHEARDLLSHEVFVEEKVDGSNVGFSVDAHGALRAQNRGSYLDLGALQGQWKSLGRWLAVRRSALEEVLFPDLALFGEWCYAVHTIRYTRLPDWVLAFDVYDRASDEFWGVRKRNDLARALGLAVVPQRAQGRVTLDQLKHIMSSSELASGPAEGPTFGLSERTVSSLARNSCAQSSCRQSNSTGRSGGLSRTNSRLTRSPHAHGTNPAAALRIGRISPVTTNQGPVGAGAGARSPRQPPRVGLPRRWQPRTRLLLRPSARRSSPQDRPRRQSRSYPQADRRPRRR